MVARLRHFLSDPADGCLPAILSRPRYDAAVAARRADVSASAAADANAAAVTPQRRCAGQPWQVVPSCGSCPFLPDCRAEAGAPPRLRLLEGLPGVSAAALVKLRGAVADIRASTAGGGGAAGQAKPLSGARRDSSENAALSSLRFVSQPEAAAAADRSSQLEPPPLPPSLPTHLRTPRRGAQTLRSFTARSAQTRPAPSAPPSSAPSHRRGVRAKRGASSVKLQPTA